MVTIQAVSAELERLLTEVASQIQLSSTAQAAVREEFRKLAAHLTNGALAPFRPYLFAQGSFRIGTTVRPLSQEEFDLDFIVELLNPPQGSYPRTVYELVAGEIDSFAGFQGSVERKDRCIRLSYPGNFHIDAVPAIPAEIAGVLIPDKTTSGLEWRHTDPQGYVRWFEDRALPAHLRKYKATIDPLPADESVTAKTPLQIDAQLLKRHHQLHSPDEKLRTPSIVLTTIAGLEAAGHDSLGQCLNDTVAGIEGYARTLRHVYHPTAQDELLSETWNEQTIYAQFQSTTAKMVTQWDQVMAAQGQGIPIIAKLLKEMFGADPVTRAVAALGREAGTMKKAGRLSAGGGGAVSIVAKGRGDKRGTFYGDA